jgi:hypothetical protein
MSFAEAKIKEYRKDATSKDQPLTEVRFAVTRSGNFVMTISKDRRLAKGHDVSEEEIESQLAEEGLIRLPPASQQSTGEFKRIDVGGKPMSEVIIEERR